MEKIGILGAGTMARMHLRMLSQLHAREIGRIEVFDPDPEVLRELCDFAAELALPVRTRDRPASVVRGADVVIPLTTAERPYIEARWLKRPSLYAAVSLLDPRLEVVRQSDLIVVDDLGLCLQEGRPLERLAKRGRLDSSRVTTIGAVIAREDSRPCGDGRKVFFNPMGSVITDLVVAEALFRRARAEGIGTELPFP
jgi:ornithine cyclodeaminase/alanine dehydrogenase-like protein (mu-crystallin family)